MMATELVPEVHACEKGTSSAKDISLHSAIIQFSVSPDIQNPFVPGWLQNGEIRRMLPSIDVCPDYSLVRVELQNLRVELVDQSLPAFAESSDVDVPGQTTDHSRVVNHISKLLQRRDERRKTCLCGHFRRPSRLDRIFSLVSSLPVFSLASIDEMGANVLDALYDYLKTLSGSSESFRGKLLSSVGMIHTGLVRGSVRMVVGGVNAVLSYSRENFVGLEDYSNILLVQILESCLRLVSAFRSCDDGNDENNIRRDFILKCQIDMRMNEMEIIEMFSTMILSHVDRIFRGEFRRTAPGDFSLDIIRTCLQLLQHMCCNSIDNGVSYADTERFVRSIYSMTVVVRLMGSTLGHICREKDGESCSSSLNKLVEMLLERGGDDGSILPAVRLQISRILHFSFEEHGTLPDTAFELASETCGNDSNLQNENFGLVERELSERKSDATKEGKSRSLPVPSQDTDNGRVVECSVMFFKKAAARTLAVGFRLFYPTFNAQLSFITETLDTCETVSDEYCTEHLILMALFDSFSRDEQQMLLLLPVAGMRNRNDTEIRQDDDRIGMILRFLAHARTCLIQEQLVHQGSIELGNAITSFLCIIQKHLWRRLFFPNCVTSDLIPVVVKITEELISSCEMTVEFFLEEHAKYGDSCSWCSASFFENRLFQELLPYSVSLLHLFLLSESTTFCERRSIISSTLPRVLCLLSTIRKVLLPVSEESDKESLESLFVVRDTQNGSGGSLGEETVLLNDDFRCAFLSVTFVKLELQENDYVEIRAVDFSLRLTNTNMLCLDLPIIFPAEEARLKISALNSPAVVQCIVSPLNTSNIIRRCERALEFLSAISCAILCQGQPLEECENGLSLSIMRRLFETPGLERLETQGKSMHFWNEFHARKGIVKEVVQEMNSAIFSPDMEAVRAVGGNIMSSIELAFIGGCLNLCGLTSVVANEIRRFRGVEKVELHFQDIVHFVWKRASKIRFSILKRKQVSEEEQFAQSQDGILERCKFLWSLSPSPLENVDENQELESSSYSEKVDTIVDSALDFVLSDMDTSEMKKVIRVQMERAMSRRNGLKSFLSLLLASSKRSCGTCLMFLYVTIRSGAFKGQRGFHYHSNIEASGMQLKNDVRKNWLFVIEKICEEFVSQQDYIAQRLSVRCLMYDYFLEDARALSENCPLSTMAGHLVNDDSETATEGNVLCRTREMQKTFLSETVWSFFQFLSQYVETNPCPSLEHTLVNVVAAHVMKLGDEYKSNRRLDQEVLKVLSLLQRHSLMLADMTDNADAMCSIVDLAVQSSPPVRIVCLKLLRCILPRVSISNTEQIQGTVELLIRNCLELLGHCIYMVHFGEMEMSSSVVECCHMAQQIFLLLHDLNGTTLWQSQLQCCLDEYWLEIRNFLEHFDESCSRLFGALGSLSLLGGLSFGLWTGAIIKYFSPKGEKMIGQVSFFSEEQRKVKVQWLGSNEEVVNEQEFETDSDSLGLLVNESLQLCPTQINVDLFPGIRKSVKLLISSQEQFGSVKYCLLLEIINGIYRAWGSLMSSNDSSFREILCRNIDVLFLMSSMTSEYEKNVDSPLECCTYFRTGRNFVPQHWYQCHTCGIRDREGVCAVCARVCHKGHDIEYSRCSSFFCDCGSQPHRHSCHARYPMSKRDFSTLWEYDTLLMSMGNLSLLVNQIFDQDVATSHEAPSSVSMEGISGVAELESLGFPADICRRALAEHGGDVNASASWLSSNGVGAMRQSMYEELCQMGFPRSACVKALKKCGDDMNLAATWLLDNSTADDREARNEIEDRISSDAEVDALFTEHSERRFEISFSPEALRDSLESTLIQMRGTKVGWAASLEETSVEPGTVVCVSRAVRRSHRSGQALEKLTKRIGHLGIVVRPSGRKRYDVAFLDNGESETNVETMKSKYLFPIHDGFTFSNVREVRKKTCDILYYASISRARKALIEMLLKWSPSYNPFSNFPATSLKVLCEAVESDSAHHCLFGLSDKETQMNRGREGLSKIYDTFAHTSDSDVLNEFFVLASEEANKYGRQRLHLRIAESRHPVGTPGGLCEIRFWGTHHLCVIFDPRTRLGHNESLTFYSDAACLSVMQKFSSSNLRSSRPVVLPVSRFWFRLAGPSQSMSWGYRFTVAPISWKVSRDLSGRCPNLYSVTHALRILTVLHNKCVNPPSNSQELLDSALLLALTPFAPLRLEVCRLLQRIASSYDNVASDYKFSLHMLKVARVQLERQFRKRAKENVLEGHLFLAMLELMLTVRKNLRSDLCISSFLDEKECEHHLYRCSCGSDVCFSCAMVCHRDHDAEYKGYSVSACHCNCCSCRDFHWKRPDDEEFYDLDVARWKFSDTPRELFDHSSWFEQMFQTVRLLECFDKGGSLPSAFIAEAWLETQKKVIMRESSHPYSLVNEKSSVTITGVKSLLITFDKRSATDEFEFLCFSTHRPDGDELARLSGQELAYKRIVANSDHFFYSFRSDMYIHEGIMCDMCRCNPICGVRFKCTQCDDHDLCQQCFMKKTHDETHLFLAIRRPAHLNPARVPCLYPDHWIPTVQFKGRMHHNIRCSHCGTKPIIGIRYRCENCSEFNLCERCGRYPDRCHDRQHTFLVVERPLPPEQLLPSNNLPYGLLYRRERDTHWGFSFTVTPAMTRDEMISLFSENREKLTLIEKNMNTWCRDMDERLVEYVNEGCEKGWMNMQSEDVHPRDAHFDLLKDVSLESIRSRFIVLKLLNAKLSALLPLCDMSDFSNQSHIGDVLRRLRGLIFYDTKLDVWNKAIRTTCSEKEVCTVYLNRHLKAELWDKADAIRSRNSLFMQTFSQLSSMNVELLRKKDKGSGFRVVFVGEGADDYGGPWREAMTDIFVELEEGEVTNLLIRTPNGQSGQGQYIDKFMPNPALVDMDKYVFLGKLIGIALRTGQIIPLNFPSLVWKSIVAQEVGEEDIFQTDEETMRSLAYIRDIGIHGLRADNFEELLGSTFIGHRSDGIVVQLKSGGEDEPVTFENRLEFVQRYTSMRLHECEPHAKAILQGMSLVVPARWLFLFKWSEIERLVCGSPDMDLRMLKRHTVYDGFSSRSRVVQDMWAVLEECSSRDRSLFLRFVSGRARLPLTDGGFDRSMKVQILERTNPDKYLPQSHTCFFSIELPRYSCRRILREKLLYAIHHCTAIDTDFTQHGEISRNLLWRPEAFEDDDMD